MIVYVTKITKHFPNHYLVQWSIGNNTYHDWFPTMKEIKEYISSWDATMEVTK